MGTGRLNISETERRSGFGEFWQPAAVVARARAPREALAVRKARRLGVRAGPVMDSRVVCAHAVW